MNPSLRSRRCVARIAVAIFTVVGSNDISAAATGCDRACLTITLNRYLTAVMKHDPSAAALFTGYRETDNARAVKPGEGVWKTATALGKVQRRYADPENGSAGYLGTLEEGSNTAIATLRLKIVGRKITEAEWIIARADNGGPMPGRGGLMKPEGLAANPPPSAPVSKDARSSREAMIAAANSYFDGLQAHDGSLVLAHPGCLRIENGVNVTAGVGGRAPAASGSAPVPGAVSGDCTSNFEQMSMIAVTARRYPVVDEEAGYVLGMVIFIRPPGSPLRRNLLSEWFRIENNKIRGIYAAMYYADQTTALPNWPPYDGNWPLSPGLSATASGRR